MAVYKIVKLNSGEELIAQFTETNTHYILKRPAAIVFNEQTFAMIPFMPFAKEHTVSVCKAGLTEAEPEERLVAEYKNIYEKQAIIVPEQQIVIAK